MAQHDYDIANQSGANFRADLNNALDAIVSNNSGSSQPSTTFAYEWWVDTSANLLKLRNSANNAWITLPLSITASNETSGALTVNGNLTTTGTVDVNGQELILDADADTSITADTDDQIDIRVGAVDVLTLTNSHLVLKGTTPKITIGDGGAEDTALIFDGNAQDFYIGLDDSEDDLVIGKGSTVGTTSAIVIDENLKSTFNGDVLVVGSSTDFRGEILINNTSSASGSHAAIRFVTENESTGLIIGKHSSGFTEADLSFIFNELNTAMQFGTNNTEKFRITNDGKLGVGTTSPNQKVDIKADNGDQLRLDNDGDRFTQLTLANNGTTKANFNFDNTDALAEIFAVSGAGIKFSTNASESMRIASNGAVTINGSLSKGSGSFKINHPLESKKDSHNLYHSFVEAPKADNIYRGIVSLKNGVAKINLDEESKMTDGTFVALNREVQCYTSNETDYDAVKGFVTGNILNIESENLESEASISWLVIGERQDQEIYNSTLTDENGKLIVEKLKSEEE